MAPTGERKGLIYRYNTRNTGLDLTRKGHRHEGAGRGLGESGKPPSGSTEETAEPAELELELIQSHMAQKPVLRGEVGCACVAREISVERRGMAAAIPVVEI